MPERLASLIERLKSEGDKTASFFASLNTNQWTVTVYHEKEPWTVRSILSHYITSEQEILRLLIDIHNGGTGAREDFDLDGYNASQQKKTAELSPPALLEQFAAMRVQTVAFVSGLSEADLEKQGHHPYLGLKTLGEMVKIVFMHNQMHHRDLRKVIEGS